MRLALRSANFCMERRKEGRKEDSECYEMDGKSSVASAANFPDYFPLDRSFNFIGRGRADPHGAPRRRQVIPHLTTWPPLLRGQGRVVRDIFFLLSSVRFISPCCSTIFKPAGHSSTSHEPANALIDLRRARSYSLPAQPICDSLHCWQKIPPVSEGPSNCPAPQ